MWLVYALAASALWGFEYAIVGRILGDRVSPVSLVAIQMAVGSVALGAVALVTGALRRDLALAQAQPGLWLLVALGILVFTLGNLMIAVSIQEGNAVLAGFVEISYPLFIVLFSLMLGWGGSIGPRTVIGGLVILAGVYLLQSEQ